MAGSVAGRGATWWGAAEWRTPGVPIGNAARTFWLYSKFPSSHTEILLSPLMRCHTTYNILHGMMLCFRRGGGGAIYPPLLSSSNESGAGGGSSLQDKKNLSILGFSKPIMDDVFFPPLSGSPLAANVEIPTGGTDM